MNANDMEKTIEIPEGYEARIEGNKVILERKNEKQPMDEKIRQYLIQMVNAIRADDFELSGLNKEEVFAYLERQKEQKPAEWSEEDGKMLIHIISDLREFRDCETDEELVSDYEREIEWLKSFRPQPQKLEYWTEEDERIFNQLIRRMDGHHYTYEVLQSMKRWLQERMKLLRPYWKPSEEQVFVLRLVAEEQAHGQERKEILFSLYDALKKLM